MVQYGPVISVIEAGHYVNSQTGECRVCRTEFPCATMMLAKKDQRGYGERLSKESRTVRDETRLILG